MARFSSVDKLLDLYRAEIGASMDPAHNLQARDNQVRALQRHQEMLWDDFDWPFLRVERFLELQKGQRLYEMPDDMTLDRVSEMSVNYNQEYCRLSAGIYERHYSTFNSELNEQCSPPTRWRVYEDEKIEVWPIPSSNFDPATNCMRLKITGTRRLKPLVDDDDRADLDDRLITLYAAAEFLARAGTKDAPLKLEQAKRRNRRMRGQQIPEGRPMAMFGVGDMERGNRSSAPYRAVYNDRNP